MSNAAARWGDLQIRVISGLTMVAIGIFEVWIGGHVFHISIAAVCGAMVWELCRMLDAEPGPTAVSLALLSGAAVLVASYAPVLVAAPLLLAPALVGFGQMSKGKKTFAVYTAFVLLAGFSLISLRDNLGIIWVLWFLIVVVLTDVAGYFAGRIIGGPKFWPKISPKKTWSGTVAGWAAAALVGLAFNAILGGGAELVVVSVVLSFASQLGDIAESAIKRRAGVKDSSNLIPGHGGFLDRFDGMLGAALGLLLMGLFIGFPAGL